MILELATSTSPLGPFVATIRRAGFHGFMISLRVFNDFVRFPRCLRGHLGEAVPSARCRIPGSQGFMISLRVFNDSRLGPGNEPTGVPPQDGARNLTK